MNELSLKDFISKTIQDIYVGVNEGKKIINETLECADEKTNIDFDVAVTTNTANSTATDGKVEIKVLNVFSVGASGKSDKENISSMVNRIHFSVPLTLRKGHEIEVDTEYRPFDKTAGY